MAIYVKNHRAANSLDGGSPTSSGKDEIKGEGTKNSSDRVWVF